MMITVFHNEGVVSSPYQFSAQFSFLLYFSTLASSSSRLHISQSCTFLLSITFQLLLYILGNFFFLRMIFLVLVLPFILPSFFFFIWTHISIRAQDKHAEDIYLTHAAEYVLFICISQVFPYQKNLCMSNYFLKFPL